MEIQSSHYKPQFSRTLEMFNVLKFEKLITSNLDFFLGFTVSIYVYLHVGMNICIRCLQRPKAGVGSPGTGLTDSCEPLM